MRDVVGESVAGILQRPMRTVLTLLGAVLGVGAFVAVLGLTATASGQISVRFTQLMATEVTATDEGRRHDPFPMTYFTEDAERRATSLNGVRNAGVAWQLPNPVAETVRSTPDPQVSGENAIAVLAASPGTLRAIHPRTGDGVLFNEFHDERAERVVVLGATAARLLGVHTVAGNRAIFIDDMIFTVVGIIDDVGRRAETLSSVVVPRRTATELWGLPEPETEVTMIVDTELGAAQTVAGQLALALRPDFPEAFRITAPPDPQELRDAVSTDLGTLFLLLAGIGLVIGAFGIANTTLVAVLERTNEIGLRRALGARRRHIAGQFLAEAGLLGTLGGLIGTAMAVSLVVIVAAARQWTPIIEPLVTLPAPLIGTVTGVLAGIYPAVRAAAVQPARALAR